MSTPETSLQHETGLSFEYEWAQDTGKTGK
jgi:hypothetical protein